MTGIIHDAYYNKETKAIMLKNYTEEDAKNYINRINNLLKLEERIKEKLIEYENPADPVPFILKKILGEEQ